MNLRAHSTTTPSAPTAASIPPTTADHFDPLPQLPVHDPSAASFIEADVSSTIAIFGGTGTAGILAPQPLFGYPAAPVAGPTPPEPTKIEAPPCPPAARPPIPERVPPPPAPVSIPPVWQPAPLAPAAASATTVPTHTPKDLMSSSIDDRRARAPRQTGHLLAWRTS